MPLYTYEANVDGDNGNTHIQYNDESVAMGGQIDLPQEVAERLSGLFILSQGGTAKVKKEAPETVEAPAEQTVTTSGDSDIISESPTAPSK